MVKDGEEVEGIILMSDSVHRPLPHSATFKGNEIHFKFCFSWSCLKMIPVVLPATILKDVAKKMSYCSDTAEDELFAIRNAVKEVEKYLLSAHPVLGGDIAGNKKDTKEYGRLDCVDNATNTNNILHIINAYYPFRYWTISPPIKNKKIKNILSPHWSAVVRTEDDVFIKKYHNFIGANVNAKSTTWTVDTWLTTFGAKPFLIEKKDWQLGNLADVVWRHATYSSMFHKKGCYGSKK